MTVLPVLEPDTAITSDRTTTDSSESLQTIKVTADSCELATKAAELSLAAVPSAVSGPDAGSEQRRAGRQPKSITLGDLNGPKSAKDLGAPFDPCKIPWEKFPEQVRVPPPADASGQDRRQLKSPRLMPQEPGDSVDIRCRYDNSDQKIAIDISGKTPPSKVEGEGAFLVEILWDQDGTADPAKRPGATPKGWRGKNPAVDPPGTRGLGYVQPLTEPSNPGRGKECMAAVRISVGAAGAAVSNARFPNVDPCVIAETIVAAIDEMNP